MADSPTFDLEGTLPDGPVLLEASAGTGKTFTLAGLATRHVADGVPVGRLCVVTFTEAATEELRDRIRRALRAALDHLDAGCPEHESDPILRAISDADEPTRRSRQERLRQAIADFDTATVTTIHGFSQRVLSFAAEGVDHVLDPRPTDVAEVVSDLATEWFRDAADIPVELAKAADYVAKALALRDAQLHPRPEDSPDGRSASCFVDAARAAVLARRKERRVRTYDDLLADARDDVVTTPALAEAVRSRYDVVLIDEFQDTDQVQWQLFRTLFLPPGGPDTGRTSTDVSGPRSIVLVGDPKQSIYRFRSADIASYRDAGEQIERYGRLGRLGQNWRSDANLVDALDAVFSGVELGDGVTFESVDAHHPPDRLSGRDAGRALQFRMLVPEAGETFSAERAAAAIRGDVVRQVGRLLDGEVLLAEHGGHRRLTPGDLAVLTRSNADAQSLAAALSAHGIPATTGSTLSVATSAAADQWRVLLRALERPSSSGAVAAAALGWFFGHPAVRLGTGARDDVLEAVQARLREWTDELERRGPLGLLARAKVDTELERRLLGRVGGERDLTDLEHLAELLHDAVRSATPTPATVAAAFVSLLALPDDSDLVARRIERDDHAVQVLTAHRSKGLEFGVVLCPFFWRGSVLQPPYFASVEGGGRILDCGPLAVDGKAELHALAAHEEAAEAKRLLYVGLTRARHRLVVWWASPGRNKDGRPAKRTCALDELLASRAGDDRTSVHPEVDGVHALAARSAHIDVVDLALPAQPVATRVAASPPSDLAVATFGREIDRSWRVWSFTAMKAAAETAASIHLGTGAASSLAAASPADVNDDAGANDEHEPLPPAEVTADTDAPTSTTGAGAAALGSGPANLLAALPGGTSFGTLVHRVLERVDFTADDLTAEIGRHVDEALAWRAGAVDRDPLVDGLREVLRTPLGGPAGRMRLCDLERADRLDELSFDLPFTARTTAGALGTVLADHLPVDDPFRPWARDLASNGFDADLTGMLTGSIDLAFRVGEAGARQTGQLPLGVRYFVADYKTNRLGDASAYDGEGLVQAMEHSHYPLQAALYLVALHRYLRWRLPTYDPAEHLGGACYLFLRGMSPETSRGVCWWTPPASAIVALSDAIGGIS